MNRYALVDADGIVQNVVLWDGNPDTWQPPTGLTPYLLDDTDALHPVGIGWTYLNGTWTPAEPPPMTSTTVPVDVDPAQIAALIDQATKATTVTATRNVLTALLQQLQPE